VELRPHNRYGGAKTLRQRWQAHIQSTLSRPVLVVDEAQEMQSGVHAELRLLASADLDSHILLTIVLAGDGRLAERLHSDDLLPLASRGHTMRLPTSASRTPYRPGGGGSRKHIDFCDRGPIKQRDRAHQYRCCAMEDLIVQAYTNA
ncbi:MAG: hypothetical protein QOF70_3237, partial [Acetobacteraceae bacterium]|nr:hypothetical protein [Acetobacteraceae bacterium]